MYLAISRVGPPAQPGDVTFAGDALPSQVGPISEVFSVARTDGLPGSSRGSVPPNSKWASHHLTRFAVVAPPESGANACPFDALVQGKLADSPAAPRIAYLAGPMTSKWQRHLALTARHAESDQTPPGDVFVPVVSNWNCP